MRQEEPGYRTVEHYYLDLLVSLDCGDDIFELRDRFRPGCATREAETSWHANWRFPHNFRDQF